MTKGQLDLKICDCVPDATNTQTYREYIVAMETEIIGIHENLDVMTDFDLTNYLENLDYLMEK